MARRPRIASDLLSDPEVSDAVPQTARRSRNTRHVSSDKENNPLLAAKSSKTSTSARRATQGLQEMDIDPSQVVHERVLAEEVDQDYYDPDQPMEERRKIRKKYRNIQRDADDNKTEWIKSGNNGILEAINQSNEAFKNVKQTSDATLDSRLLVTITDLTFQRAKHMQIGNATMGLDVDEFVGKCEAFMKRNNRPRNSREEADDDDDARDWAWLGRAAGLKGSKRPALSDFMFGPMSVVKKARVQKARRQGLKKKVAAKPIEIAQEDIKESENNTLKLVMKVHRTLEDYFDRTGETQVNLFKVIVNPDSYSQTVENIFYLSFLVKEGKVAIFEDDDGIPVLYLTEQATADDYRDNDVRRHQMIFSMTMWEWKQLKDAFEITESIIPTREKEVVNVGANGWYC